MKTARKTSKKPTPRSTGVDVTKAYIDYLLDHGRRPASVFRFCKDLGISEDVFYSVAGSFEGLEERIWTGFISSVVSRLNNEQEFSLFTTRDKVLTFYYALFEELKQNRSFVLLQAGDLHKPTFVPVFLKGFKAVFEQFLESILSEGQGNGEIATRPYLDKRYPRLFWLHLGFILTFWRNDNSADFEKTDVAIEKSVNLAFDLIGKGAVDSAVDFGKFLYQTARV